MPHRGSLNTPAQIPNIVRFIAVERGEDLFTLTAAISANADRIFGSFQP
jgi:TatD DNase family protein